MFDNKRYLKSKHIPTLSFNIHIILRRYANQGIFTNGNSAATFTQLIIGDL